MVTKNIEHSTKYKLITIYNVWKIKKIFLLLIFEDLFWERREKR